MDNSTEKKRIQTREQIMYNIVQVLQNFPQYTVPQHFLHVLRKKNDPLEPYFWSEEEFLKKWEHYYDELLNELAILKEEEKERKRQEREEFE